MYDLALAISLGLSHFSLAPNGTWYQEGFPYEVTQTVPSISVGIDTKYFELGYTYLGKVKSSAEATASDADYNDGPPYWPLSHWNGSGDVSGLYAGGHVGPITVGAYVYKPTWKMDIPDWRHCAECQPQHLTVWHDPKWEVTPYVKVQYKGLSLTYYHHIAAGQDEWPAIYEGKVINFSYTWEY